MASGLLPDLLQTLPELVRDSMLIATIDGDRTIHPQPFPRRNKPKQYRWVRERNLGRGGGGEVWLEKMLEGDDHLPKLRAVKSIRTPEVENILRPNAGKWVRELEALAKFSQNKYQHFFVKSYGWYMTPGLLNISMEYYRDGDLNSYLADVKTIPTDEVREIAQQVLGALDLMHTNGFAHRDLKPANILIKAKPPRSWWVKLCDFGLSKRPEALAENSTVKGTPSFMAPETLGFPFTGDPKKANPYFIDMWCFGETLFRCHTGHASFEDTKQLWEYQQDKRRFPADELQCVKARTRAIRFIRDLMNRVPSERPDTTGARDHPWLKGEVGSSAPKLVIERVLRPSRRRPSLGTQGVERRSHGLLPINYDQISEASGRWSDTITKNDPPPQSYFSPLSPGTVRSPPLSSPMTTTSAHPEVPFLLPRSSVSARPALRRVHEDKHRAESAPKRSIVGTYLFDILPKDPSLLAEVDEQGTERIRPVLPSDSVSNKGSSQGKKRGFRLSEKKSKTRAGEPPELEEIMKLKAEMLNHLSKPFASARHNGDQVPTESRKSEEKSKPTASLMVPEEGMRRIVPLPCPMEYDTPLARKDDRDGQNRRESLPVKVSRGRYVSRLVPNSRNRSKSPTLIVREPRKGLTLIDPSESWPTSPIRISPSTRSERRHSLRGLPLGRGMRRSPSKEKLPIHIDDG